MRDNASTPSPKTAIVKLDVTVNENENATSRRKRSVAQQTKMDMSLNVLAVPDPMFVSITGKLTSLIALYHSSINVHTLLKDCIHLKKIDLDKQYNRRRVEHGVSWVQPH